MKIFWLDSGRRAGVIFYVNGGLSLLIIFMGVYFIFYLVSGNGGV
jgi:hypothetical protein